MILFATFISNINLILTIKNIKKMNKKELNLMKIYNPMIGLNSIETGRSSNHFNSDKKSFIDFIKKRRRKNNESREF